MERAEWVEGEVVRWEKRVCVMVRDGGSVGGVVMSLMLVVVERIDRFHVDELVSGYDMEF